MPSDESKGSQLDAIGSLAQRQLDNTLPGHRCHLVRIGEDLHDRLGSALASRTIGRIFEYSRNNEPLHVYKAPGWRRRIDRYGAADRGRSKPCNQRWIDSLRSTTQGTIPSARSMVGRATYRFGIRICS